MILYVALAVLLMLISVLSEKCYQRGVRDTEARWSDSATRSESIWNNRACRWREEINDLNKALAPYGEQLCAKFPREGYENISVPFYEYLAVRASLSSCARLTPGSLDIESIDFESLWWRAHRLFRAKRPE